MQKHLAWFLALILCFGCSCKSNKQNKPAPDTITAAQPQTMLPAQIDFDRILEKEAIPAIYYYDSVVLQSQVNLPGKVSVLDAFAQALPALFIHADSIGSADDLYGNFTAQPESYGLASKPSAAEVKNAILREMKADTSLTIYLLPGDTETGSPEGVTLFPPEFGEKVQDYWIWYLKARFFPGPIWMLVKRDGSKPAYHYGYM